MLQACGYPTLMMIKKKDVENAIVIHSLFHNLSTTFPQVINDCCCLSQNNVVFLQLSSIRDKGALDTYRVSTKMVYVLREDVNKLIRQSRCSSDAKIEADAQLMASQYVLDRKGGMA